MPIGAMATFTLSPSCPPKKAQHLRTELERLKEEWHDNGLPHNDSHDPNNLLSRGQEIAVDVPEDPKVPIKIHLGEISHHHGQTIHGSGPNTTDDRRIAAVIRYCTPQIAQQVADKD